MPTRIGPVAFGICRDARECIKRVVRIIEPEWQCGKGNALDAQHPVAVLCGGYAASGKIWQAGAVLGACVVGKQNQSGTYPENCANQVCSDAYHVLSFLTSGNRILLRLHRIVS